MTVQGLGFRVSVGAGGAPHEYKAYDPTLQKIDIISIARGFAYVVDITDPLTLVVELSCLGIAQAVASAALDSYTGV